MNRTSWFVKLLLGAAILLLTGGLVWVVRGSLNPRYETVETGGLVSDEEPADSRPESTGSASISVTDEMTEAAAEPGEAEIEDQEPEELSLLFAGDVLLSDHVTNAYDRAGGISGVLSQGILDEIEKSDIFMVNEEFPFSERGTQAGDKQFTFRLSPSRVSMMNEMGIDIVTLANNHALDFGTDALLDTLTTLDGAGIKRVGAGANIDEAKKLEIIETKGMRVGFLGASRVIPVSGWNAGTDTPGMLTTYDPAILLREIKKAREECDYLVVYVHWGIERAERPEEYQRLLGKQYIDAGADIVVGSHPHVLQGLEYYNGKPIIYSLGNFVFGSSIPRTAMLKVKVAEGNTSLSLVPCTSSAGYTQTLEAGSKITEFGQYMTGISYGVTVTPEGEVVPQ